MHVVDPEKERERQRERERGGEAYCALNGNETDLLLLLPLHVDSAHYSSGSQAGPRLMFQRIISRDTITLQCYTCRPTR